MISPITRDEATEIIRLNLKQPARQVVICAGGKWYDCRSASKKEIDEFINQWVQDQKKKGYGSRDKKGSGNSP